MDTKNKRIKRLIKHLIFKISIFAIVLVIPYVINFPEFTNEMAMAQFENNNYAFAAWDSFIRFRNLFNSYYDLIICLFANMVFYDIYKIIKINKGEN